jgi:cell division protein FtsI/penicillin-binding protein 2
VLGGGAAVVLGGGEDGVVTVAQEYARAFARQDPRALYPLLDDEARGRVTQARFVQLHREALTTATVTRIVAGPVKRVDDHRVDIPFTVRTRVFGTVRKTLALTFTGDGDRPGVDWRRNLVFPGVPAGGELTRTVRLPPRATLLSRDEQVLARGDARTPDTAIADVAAQTVGQLGPIPEPRAAELEAAGVPEGALVGISGLERALDERLRGRPGGILSAGGVVLGQQAPRQGPAVRSTIAPSVERAAVAALAGRLGGVVALVPRTGELLAFAGIAFSGLQPPGSTFKMVTLTGALENGVTDVKASFPVQTAATLEGVELQNANGESCGGSLANSFAESCNSVFGPLGVRLGPERLVDTAEKFGFNRPPDIPGAATSTIPPAAEIGDDLAVGSTAIGQGRVLATSLQMATVAATIGLGGRKPHLTVAADERVDNTKLKPVIDPSAARTAGRLMLDVVAYGTGRAAAIPGVKVGGKTGTAELESTQDCQPVEDDPESCKDESVTTDTDAWFAALAPGDATTPKVAVGVLLVRAGAGGDVAAPVARQVLIAAL